MKKSINSASLTIMLVMAMGASVAHAEEMSSSDESMMQNTMHTDEIQNDGMKNDMSEDSGVGAKMTEDAMSDGDAMMDGEMETMGDADTMMHDDKIMHDDTMEQ